MSGLGKFDNPAEIEKFLGPGESGLRFVHLLGRYPGVIQGRTVIPVPGILLDHHKRHAGLDEVRHPGMFQGVGPGLPSAIPALSAALRTML